MFMNRTWLRADMIAFRASQVVELLPNDFPRAVPGEEYERFARSVWSQSQRWLQRHRHQLIGVKTSIHDARDVLRTILSTEFERPLFDQEERLLGELLQTEWPTIERRPGRLTPEIPAFLIGPR